jgi:hypothetical protein
VCAGKTGKEYVVQVHYDEGVAIRIDPEPCVVAREGGDEASAGARAGQPLSREKPNVLGADTLPTVEGNTDGCANASARTAQRGQRPWHVWKLLAREPGDLTRDRAPLSAVRIGKVRSRSR